MNRRAVSAVVVLLVFVALLMSSFDQVNPGLCTTETVYQRQLWQLDKSFTGISGRFYLASGMIQSARYYGFTNVLKDGGKASDTIPEKSGVVYEDVKSGAPWMVKKQAINPFWDTPCKSAPRPESIPNTTSVWYEFHVPADTGAYMLNLPGQ